MIARLRRWRDLSAVTGAVLAATACGPAPDLPSTEVSLASSKLRITETMDGPSPPEGAPDGGASPVPRPKASPSPPVVAVRAPPTPPNAKGCTTTCKPDSYSPIPTADEPTVERAVASTLDALRECLDRVGAEAVRPLLHLRFSEDGVLLNRRVDVGGYEDLQCVKEVGARPLSVATSRGTTMHCEYRCPAAPRQRVPDVRFGR